MVRLCDFEDPITKSVSDEDYTQVADDDHDPDPLWGDEDDYDWTGR